MNKLQNPDWKGAGILLYYIEPDTNEIYILSGLETKYLSDYRSDLPDRYFDGNELDAHIYYTEECVKLSESSIGKYVTYDTPISSSRGFWKANFRFSEPDKGRSLPKGKRQDIDHTDKETAERELLEETGIDFILPQRLSPFHIDRGYSFYAYEIEPEEVPFYEEQIEAHNQQRCQELHEVQFVPLTYVRGNLNTFNGISRLALRTYFKLGSSFKDCQIVDE